MTGTRHDCPMCHGLGWIPEPPSRDELLRQVAQVYRDGYTTGPTAHVAAVFRIAHRTAGVWISQAREAGHLPPTTQGKKAG
jgi:transposase